LVKSISELNKFVQEELTKEAPNENLILKKALDITSAVIKGAEIIDVRLWDESTNELYFAETAGRYWSEGKQDEVRRRRQRTFPLDAKSAGAKVFKEGVVHLMPDVNLDPDYSGTFGGIKRMIVAPIQVADKKFGVLDIRGIGESNFPKHAEAIAGLLGQQLGLYYYLATIIRELRIAKDDLKKHANEEIQTFQDLTHQLKTPITSALRWLEQTLHYAKGNESLEKRLWAIRGLCGKALRVGSNTRLFADLAQGRALNLNPRELKLDDLLKLLKEANQDVRHLVPERRNISFYVDDDSFKEAYNKDPQRKHYYYLKGLEIDVNLLEQALGDILENAAKYSWSGTKVRVFGGWTGGGRFHISVENQGLEIKHSEVNLCKKRGWQSEKAQDRSGQGTGIGLWIVDNIMTAHGGELEIKPTTSDELTHVRLIFPQTRVIR
jgi:signal transduction histidine kinase